MASRSGRRRGPASYGPRQVRFRQCRLSADGPGAAGPPGQCVFCRDERPALSGIRSGAAAPQAGDPKAPGISLPADPRMPRAPGYGTLGGKAQSRGIPGYLPSAGAGAVCRDPEAVHGPLCRSSGGSNRPGQALGRGRGARGSGTADPEGDSGYEGSGCGSGTRRSRCGQHRLEHCQRPYCREGCALCPDAHGPGQGRHGRRP